MASNANDVIVDHSHRIGVLRLALSGGVSAAIFYAICWVGAQLPMIPATHMYLQLFTDTELTSATAFIAGILWSIVFGLIGGALVAATYNALTSVDRPRA